MQSTIQLSATHTETDIQLDKDTRLALQSYHAEDGQVILHITYHSTDIHDCIRIWQSTYLIPNTDSERVRLIHADNIGIYPHWKMIRPNRPHKFTLVFGPLPKACTSFNMLEDIPEPGGFYIPNIQRNQLDVYHLNMY